MINGEKNINEARIDGKIIVYNFCAETKDGYSNCKNLKLEYLGAGTIIQP